MAHRNTHQSATIKAMPALTSGEWHGVQRALRSVEGIGCARGKRPGPIVRGFARISQFVRARPARTVAPELQPLRDFLCESARHGPAVDVLAQRLQHDGYSQAQIAALSFIAG